MEMDLPETYGIDRILNLEDENGYEGDDEEEDADGGPLIIASDMMMMMERNEMTPSQWATTIEMFQVLLCCDVTLY